MSEEPTELSPEAPEADAAEQHAEVREDEERSAGPPASRPYDVDEADAADQRHAVEMDEDDYR